MGQADAGQFSQASEVKRTAPSKVLWDTSQPLLLSSACSDPKDSDWNWEDSLMIAMDFIVETAACDLWQRLHS